MNHRLAALVHRGTKCRAACKCGHTTGWLSSEDAAKHDLKKFHIDPLTESR